MVTTRSAALMRKISILLVDDHTVVRQGLRALLSAEEDIDVVGEAENGRLAVMLARKTNPDVVVMDVAMPLLNGLEATRQILKMLPSTKVLVLTSYGDDECVSQLMDAGASGYLIKQTACQRSDTSDSRSAKRERVFQPDDCQTPARSMP